MRRWRIWVSKFDPAYPWRAQDQDDPNKLILAGHVVIDCRAETEEAPGRPSSHPPPFTVVIFGTPESDSQHQNILTFKGPVI